MYGENFFITVLFKLIKIKKTKIIIENLSCIIPKLIDQKNIENANNNEIR